MSGALVDTFIPAADDVRAGHIVQRGLMAVGDTVRAIRNDKLFRLFLGYLATQFSGGAYLQSISLYLAEYFNYGAGKISIFFAAMGVAVLFNLLLIQGYAQRVLSPRTIIRLCALTVACMFGIQLLAIGVLGTPEKSVLEVVVWSSSLLIYGGFNLSITTYTALLPDGTSSRDQGKVMAACGQLSGVAWFISGFMVGYLVMSHQMLLMAMCVAVTLLGFLAIKRPPVEIRV